MEIPLQRLHDDEARTVIEPTSYIRSYKHLASFVSSQTVIDEPLFIAAAHMVYGWMPTTLEFGDGSLADGARLLFQAGSRDPLLTEDELAALKELINNSIVGTSKLLHFRNPKVYPIWDSRVYRWIHEGNFSYYRLEQPANYVCYAKALREVTSEAGYDEIHKSVESKLGYEVSRLRSAELIMFLRGNG